MKDGYRFVDCDMHIMEPVHLFAQYLAPAFQSMVTGVVLGWSPQSFHQFPWLIDGMPLNQDSFLLQYNCIRGPFAVARNNRNVRFAAERGYDPEAQLMGIELEGIALAVLFPTLGLYFIAREGMDLQLSQAICRAYNDWLYDFCQYSPDQCTEEDFAKADTAAAQRERKAMPVGDSVQLHTGHDSCLACLSPTGGGLRVGASLRRSVTLAQLSPWQGEGERAPALSGMDGVLVARHGARHGGEL